MFKKLEAKWNSKVPVYLQNRTKENFIFQVTLAMICLVGMWGWDYYQSRKFENDVKRRIAERAE